MTDKTSEPERAWVQPLDERNQRDANQSLGSPGWLGVVSEEAGGIVGYVHAHNLPVLRDALNKILPDDAPDAGPMKITFDAPQDWDGMERVMASLVDATVEVTYKPGWEPHYEGIPITEYHPTSCEVVGVLDGSVDLAYDDGAVNVNVPFSNIEEVKYL